jgi:hypothetical protein
MADDLTNDQIACFARSGSVSYPTFQAINNATSTSLFQGMFGAALVEPTLNAWKKAHPEFLKSMNRGKIIADAEVAEKLYHRACGYSHSTATAGQAPSPTTHWRYGVQPRRCRSIQVRPQPDRLELAEAMDRGMPALETGWPAA